MRRQPCADDQQLCYRIRQDVRAPDLLKMCDDTDLDILNSSMETMVEQFQEELLPVAAQLAARLVSSSQYMMSS